MLPGVDAPGRPPTRKYRAPHRLHPIELRGSEAQADLGLARPQVVVQVAFLAWTEYDKLRHPRLLGVRTDKLAGEVAREGR